MDPQDLVKPSLWSWIKSLQPCYWSKQVSRPSPDSLVVQLLVSDSSVTPWTVAHQASLSMGFPRQEYWSWVAISFSRGSSWPRDRTHISSLTGRFFTTEPQASPAQTRSGWGKLSLYPDRGNSKTTLQRVCWQEWQEFVDIFCNQL